MSLLGQLLFFAYVNDLSESMFNSLTYGSADDYNLISNHCNSLKKILINYIFVADKTKYSLKKTKLAYFISRKKDKLKSLPKLLNLGTVKKI